MCGVEALLRWEKNPGELVSPARFITLAEESGLIAALGEEALFLACHQVREWQKRNFPELSVAVNLSPLQLRKDNLVEDIREILKDTGLDPRWLELEITEGAIMKEPAKAIHTLNDLKRMGIGIPMDDFGTGYSSLSYLTHFPVGTLKIDRSFISNLFVTLQNEEITRAIIALAQKLRLTVVAEGVETKDQLMFLKEEGCEQIQGAYFAWPIPAAEFENWLCSWEKTREKLLKEERSGCFRERF